MPDIDYRSEPLALTSTGPTKFHIIKVGFSTNPTSHNDYFDFTFRDLRNEIEFRDTAYLTPRAVWKIEALVRSVGLSLPDGPFKASTDDFENRVGFGEIKHRELKSGRTVAEFNTFWTKALAIEKEPSLADIPDPTDATTDSYTLPLTRKAQAAAKTAAVSVVTSDETEPAGIDF
jgi:hypothetical protein